MEKITLVEIDAGKEVFKIYGMLQPHKPYQLKAEITYGHPEEHIVTTDIIKRIVIFVEKDGVMEK